MGDCSTNKKSALMWSCIWLNSNDPVVQTATSDRRNRNIHRANIDDCEVNSDGLQRRGE